MADLRYSEHLLEPGPVVRKGACAMGAEGVVSKRVDAPYASGDRGLWVKTKCLNRQEFVVVGRSEPEGSRAHLGSLLLGYYDNDGRLLYAGRAGTRMSDATLVKLAKRLKPLAVDRTPPGRGAPTQEPVRRDAVPIQGIG